MTGNITQNAALFVLPWTAIIMAATFYTHYHIYEHTIEKARIEARTLFEVNLVYRRWFAAHGGVYVPVTDDFKPNPYLTVPKRDVETTCGDNLTLVNPAWMTRIVFKMLEEQSPIAPRNRITSQRYLNPINKPDEWEEKALLAFEKGQKEASEITNIYGKPYNGSLYLRLMKPVYVEQGCLKCHGYQGYRVGDLRGGIGIAVPMKPYLQIKNKELGGAYAVMILMWVVGTIAIIFFTRNIRRQQEEKLDLQQARHRAMKEMLVAIMHNWRQPLNRIGLSVQSIEDAHAYGDLDDRKLKETVSFAMQELQLMSRGIDIFRDMLNTTEKEKSVEIKKALGEVVSFLQPQLKENNIAYRFTCHVHHKTTEDVSQITPCKEMTVITTYENEFKQVILAVLNNSIEAIREMRNKGLVDGNERGVLSVDFYKKADKIVIQITDNGGGIPDSVMDRIYDPYFTTKEESLYQGLGLYVAKTLLENLMNGSLKVKNIEGGTRVTIELGSIT
jgi:signal transduction histidine kinase